MSEIEYRLIEGPPDEALLSWVVEVSDSAFSNEGSIREYQRSLGTKRSILTCMAFDQGQPVGFKMGFEERPHYFESWRGGVAKSAQRRGIAEKLLLLQHTWCEQQGFRIITTTCSNDNAAMLILNLRHGLRITGSLLDRRETVKVILQKHLGEKK